MAVTGHVYGLGTSHAYNKEVDWDSDTLKCALLTSSYAPNYDTHEYYSSLTNEVAAGGGYSTGGVTLGTAVRTYNAGTHTLKLSFADAVWAASTITARYAVVYDAQTGVAGTEPLICAQDFGADFSSTSGNFTVSWNASGILTVVSTT